MDPLSIVALSAAVGGATSKFIEKVWDCGEKWILSYMQNHREKALEKAKTNGLSFLNELAERVKKLEKSNAVTKEIIENALDHPDFSVLLQKALLASAQTDNKNKHIILACIVAERLKAEPESTFSLASKMACDAIACANTRQLKILGLLATIFFIRPTGTDVIPNEAFDAYYQQWLISRFMPYRGLGVTQLDMMHLESLSCIKWDTIISRDLGTILSDTERSEYKFNLDKFKATDIGSEIYKLWKDNKLESATLTSVGTIIGTFVSDILTGTTTTFRGWEV
jgi:hypothetical protein